MKTPESLSKVIEEEIANEVLYVELLHFRLGKTHLLLLTRDLQQLVLPVPYTNVPMAPDHMLGMANVRGQIVCVLDLAIMLDIVDLNQHDQQHCIILEYQRMHIGLVVGEVQGIHRILEEKYHAVTEKEGMHRAMKGSLEFDGVECQVLEISRLLK